jgi:hypothetical protein
MKQELQEKLFSDFPALFPRCTDPMKSAMFFGFDCGDGWYDLIHRLAEQITEVCERKKCKCTATQVKEKYGTLRFYVDDTEHGYEIENLIEDAEAISSKTCEICGKPGELIGERWYRTLCDEHNKYKVKAINE